MKKFFLPLLMIINNTGTFSQNNFNSQVIAHDIKTHKVYAMSTVDGQVFHFFIQPADKNLFSVGGNFYANIDNGKVSVAKGPVKVTGLEITLSRAIDFCYNMNKIQSSSPLSASEDISKMTIRPVRTEDNLIKACCITNSREGIIFRLPEGMKQEELERKVYPFNSFVISEKMQFSYSPLRCFQITGTWTDTSATIGGTLESNKQGSDLQTIQAAKPPTNESEKWTIIRNEKITGSTGRLLLDFPADTKWEINIWAMPGDRGIATLYHTDKKTFHSMIPGNYRIKLNTVELLNVPIEKGHDTKLGWGILNIVSETNWVLADESGKTNFNSGNKAVKMALPVGTYILKLGGQGQTVIVKKGEMVDM